MDKEDFFDEAKRIANFVASNGYSKNSSHCFYCSNNVSWYGLHHKDCIYIAALKLFDLYEEDDIDE